MFKQYLTTISLFIFALNIFAADVSEEIARQAATTRLAAQQRIWDQDPRQLNKATGSVGQLSIGSIVTVVDDETLAYVANLLPQGFIVVSSDDEIEPIIGYSYTHNFVYDKDPENLLYHLLVSDMKIRKMLLDSKSDDEKNLKKEKWNDLLNNTFSLESDEQTQWPEPDPYKYPTEGWIKTLWHQGSPYNNRCPYDDKNNGLSVVGCVATAMAQIINYHQYPIDVVDFTDSDDYSSNMANFSIKIDDEVASNYNMLTWGQLNIYLDNISYPISDKSTTSVIDEFCYACGVSVNMDYSASDSGSGADTKDIASALKTKFRYISADWMLAGEDEDYFFTVLNQNMKDAKPAQMAIVSQAGGHSIVVDGFKEVGLGSDDDEYHLNYGWRSGLACWWKLRPIDNVDPPLPPPEEPFTLIRGAVVNINRPSFNVFWHPNGTIVNESSSPKCYLLEFGHKAYISDLVFNSHCYKLQNVVTISGAELESYPDYPSLVPRTHNLFRTDLPDNDPTTVWVIFNGQSERHAILSEHAFYSWGFEGLGSVPINNTLFLGTTEGSPLYMRDGTLFKGSGSDVYVVTGGGLDGFGGIKRHIENVQVFEALGYNWSNVITIPDEHLNYVVLGDGLTITQSVVRNRRSAFDLITPTSNIITSPNMKKAGQTDEVIWSVYDDIGAINADFYFTSDGWKTQSKINDQNVLSGGLMKLLSVDELSQLSKNSNTTVDSLKEMGITNITQSEGSFYWTVPPVETDDAALRLVAYDEAGNVGYDYTATFSIRSTLPPPESPNLFDPGLYSPDGHFTVNWNDVQNATSYVIWEDNNSNFTSPVEHTVNESQFVASGYANGFYYYQAKSVNDNGESGWSNIVDMEVRINSAPNSASNPSPANNATGVSRQPTLSWQGGDPNGDAVIYRVLKGTTPTSLVEITDDLTNTFWTFDHVLESNTTYYWKIWARDAKGLVTEGPVWSFTTLYQMPDLAIQSSTIDNSNPEIGSQVHIQTVIKNVG
ncbi:C10 family peptidase, partial [bacterium]|nr:C10 family peptidase [bacterium]